MRITAPSRVCRSREAGSPPGIQPTSLAPRPWGEGARGNSRAGSFSVLGGRETYQTASKQSIGRVNRTGAFVFWAVGCRSISDCQLPQ